MAKSGTKAKRKRKFSAREDRLYGQEKIYSRDDGRRVSEAVTKIYLSLSMCECGDEVSGHVNCRAAIKLQLRRILKALGYVFAEEAQK